MTAKPGDAAEQGRPQRRSTPGNLHEALVVVREAGARPSVATLRHFDVQMIGRHGYPPGQNRRNEKRRR